MDSKDSGPRSDWNEIAAETQGLNAYPAHWDPITNTNDDGVLKCVLENGDVSKRRKEVLIPVNKK